MNAHLERATILYGQSRYDLAEKELEQALIGDPDDAVAHALLGACLSQRDEFVKAKHEVELAIGLDPELPFVFYAQSMILAKGHHYPEAERAIQEAIGLDPYDPAFFSQLGHVKLARRQWQAALDAADQGLNLDPEDVNCANIRAIALVRLGKRSGASEAIATALKRDPDDADTHANMGWTLLESGEPQQAMEHFREALRLQPTSEWARMGIIEAMKARFFIYRIVLNWFLWMMKLSGQLQWGVLLGAYFGYLALNYVARTSPTLRPFVLPFIIAYVAFAIMTWVASPLFNLALRLNKFGRLALSKEQIATSNWVGLCVLGAITGLVAHFATGVEAFLVGALAAALVIPAIANIYNCKAGWPRAALSLIAVTLGLMAIAILTTSLVAQFLVTGIQSMALLIISSSIFVVYIYSAIATQFAVNYLIQVQPRHGSISSKTVWFAGLAGIILLTLGFGVHFYNQGYLAVAIAGEESQAKLFSSGIRPRLIQNKDADWQQLSEVKRRTGLLKQVGFTVVGDFEVSENRNLITRLLMREEQGAIGLITEDPAGQLTTEVTTFYADGSVLEYHNGQDQIVESHPSVTTNRLAEADGPDLFAILLEERPANEIAKLDSTQLIQRIDQQLADEVDFQLQRGGPTHDEILEMASAGGLSLDDERVSRIQSVWRRQASAKYNEYVLDRFYEDNRESLGLGMLDRRRLIAVHHLLDATGIVIDLATISKFSQADLAVFERIGPDFTPRQAMAEFAKSNPALVERASLERPIPTDIYLYRN